MCLIIHSELGIKKRQIAAFVILQSEENHRSVRQLESKVEQLETRAKLSEDKAHRTEEMLNQKVQELARVQSSFSQQNKVNFFSVTTVFFILVLSICY